MEHLSIDNYIRFELLKEVKSDGYITIKVRSVASWDEDNKPLEYEDYLSVPIKFDGGFHFNFADDGYLYLIAEDIEYHCILMKRIHQIAKEHFNNEYI